MKENKILDKKAAYEIAKQYAESVYEIIPESQVVLFGSYVNGQPNDMSDIDIAVIVNGFDGDWLETSRRLMKLRRPFNADIEPHLLDRENDESGFCQHVIDTGFKLSD
jgi:predicted nucleotidyltransferase